MDRKKIVKFNDFSKKIEVNAVEKTIFHPKV
jgi:hypothetical protein